MHIVRSALAIEALAPASASAPGAPNEDEYQTFCAALSASGRGRAFLAEYAKRNRGADTEVLLAALARLESVMRLQREGAEPLRSELRTLLGTIRAARPELQASALPVRAAKLAQLLDLLERRLEALAEVAPSELGDTRLAAVPQPDEPELPIPSPSAGPPELSLAVDRSPPPAPQTVAAPEITAMLIVPEITWLDGPPPGTEDLIEGDQADNPMAVSMADKVAALGVQPPPPAPAPTPEAPKVFEPLFPEPPSEKNDPLSALMLLSENERLALFT